MKKNYIVLLVCLFTLSMQSQWVWDYGVAIGATNYLGDIGGKDKSRQNDLHSIMRDISSHMSTDDMEAVAHYLAGSHE